MMMQMRRRTLAIILILAVLTFATAFVISPQHPSRSITLIHSSKDNMGVAASTGDDGSFFEQDEFGEKWIQKLKSFPRPLVKQAITEYVTQKNIRASTGKEAIAHPGPYVMAIVRNLKEKEQKESHTALHNHAPARGERTRPASRRNSKKTKPAETAARRRQSLEIPQHDATVSIDLAEQFVSKLYELEKPISTLHGVGPKTAEAFARLNLYTIRSLLWYFPTSFIDRTKLCRNVALDATPGQVVTLQVTVETMYYSGNVSNKLSIFKVQCHDESQGPLTITYFCGKSNRAAAGYRRLFGSPGSRRLVSGVLKETKHGFEIVQPDWVKPLDEMNEALQIEPKYRLTDRLTQSRMKNTMDKALELGKEVLDCVPEVLSSTTLRSVGWPCSLADALWLAHRPQQVADYKGGPACPPRMRLAFEELCMQQAHLALTRWRYKAPFRSSMKRTEDEKSTFSSSSWTKSPLVTAAISLLPFKLTDAQKRCLDEAWRDTVSDDNRNGRMTRLLQGDVSSGKTVVAYLLALGCLETGGRVAAILAPTAILVNQHARSLADFVSTLNRHLPVSSAHPLQKLHVESLTGSVTGAERERLLGRVEACSKDEAFFLVGTHALLTDDVADRLASLSPTTRLRDDDTGLSLAVVDEEQRFGVAQREVLSRCAAHTLYMTATPIPRTLALGGYNNVAPFVVRTGSMDVSLLDSKPQGIKPVQTHIVDGQKLEKVVDGVMKHVSVGAKVFWILPRIGEGQYFDDDDGNLGEIGLETENDTMTSVLDRYNYLARALGPNRVGMVHGRMAVSDREAELRAFADPELNVDVLVGTTVLEVGIDIPSVTILVVEDADRFGLSQLHQLRGRIGRSVKKRGSIDKSDKTRNLSCYCILLTRASTSHSMKRLNVLRETDDGVRVAMADFELRGPGQMVGLRQAGLTNGLVVDLSHHFELVFPAALLGRSFVENEAYEILATTPAPSLPSTSICELVAVENIQPMRKASACSANGLRLRMGLALFGNWNTESEENNAASAIRTLRDVSFLQANHGDCDDQVEVLFQSLSKSLGSSDISGLQPIQSSVPEIESRKLEIEPRVSDTVMVFEANGSRFVSASDNVVGDISTSDVKAREQQSSASTVPNRTTRKKAEVKAKSNINEYSQAVAPGSTSSDDSLFLVLDTETTGLSANDHVIQIAAKVLGSSNAEDQFSAYCCPPVQLDPVIENLTGITDKFLREGGVDLASGEVLDGASSFDVVYRDFCSFCNRVRKGRKICILAHNAAFDVRILNSEVKRLAVAARANGLSGLGVPLFSRDTGIESSIDTLQLVKSRELWKGPGACRPQSFSLESVYNHIFNSAMETAHNAVGDVHGLERILFSPNLKGWLSVGRRLQKPIAFPTSITSNLL